MRKIMEYSGVFAAGGIIYVLIELLFRGYSHWTMFIVGGFAVVCLYLISAMGERMWKKWIMDTAAILAIEFVSGIIINIILGWRVWDYSTHPYNLYGQICLPFALCWLGLSIPANALCTLVRRKVVTRQERQI